MHENSWVILAVEVSSPMKLLSDLDCTTPAGPFLDSQYFCLLTIWLHDMRGQHNIKIRVLWLYLACVDGVVLYICSSLVGSFGGVTYLTFFGDHHHNWQQRGVVVYWSTADVPSR